MLKIFTGLGCWSLGSSPGPQVHSNSAELGHLCTENIISVNKGSFNVICCVENATLGGYLGPIPQNIYLCNYGNVAIIYRIPKSM